MTILHVVLGLNECTNGIAVAAKLIAKEQNADLIDAYDFVHMKCALSRYDEVWVHSAWHPIVLLSCRLVLKSGKSLVRMSHANYDPLRLAYHAWKKRLVSMVDRYYLRKCDKIVATCEAEKGWIEEYLSKCCPKVEVTDMKRFFSLGDRSRELGVSEGLSRKERKEDERNGSKQETGNKKLNLLYLGRRHPLKGVEYLEAAVSELNSSNPPLPTPPLLKIVSNAFGEEKEKVWDWCDVLVLPTLSENFGLVVAEALERGKRVITTDGAPVWNPGDRGQELGVSVGCDGRLLYLNGYRDGTKEKRVELLKKAIEGLGGSR